MVTRSFLSQVVISVVFLTIGLSATAALARPDHVTSDTAARIGQPAPHPPAVDQDGQPVNLAAYYEAGPVLVYFYPKADTPGCIAQACSLRDAYEKLAVLGVVVIGVSTDNQQAQRTFKTKYGLPFLLLSDPEGEILKAFNVQSLDGMANREAFLINSGQIVWHDNSAATDKQAEEALAQILQWRHTLQDDFLLPSFAASFTPIHTRRRCGLNYRPATEPNY